MKKRIKEQALIVLLIIGTLLGVFLMSVKAHAAGKPEEYSVSDNDATMDEDAEEEEELDEIPPKLKVWIQGEIMYIHAEDAESDVAYISVNGKEFDELEDGEMCVNIKDLESEVQFITVFAVDTEGNKSKEFKLRNPYFVGEIEDNQTDLSLDNPDSIEATDPTYARGTVTDDFITQGREFFTVEASGKVFYLIVDRTENAENVYLLTEAGVNDLLNFTNYNGIDVQNGTVPMYEIPGSSGNVSKPTSSGESTSGTGGLFGNKGNDQGDGDASDDGSAQPKKNSSLYVIIAIAAVFGVLYYFLKVKKRKEDLSDAEDIDAFDNSASAEIADGTTEYEGEDAKENEVPEEDTEIQDRADVIYTSDGQVVPTISIEVGDTRNPKEDNRYFQIYVDYHNQKINRG